MMMAPGQRDEEGSRRQMYGHAEGDGRVYQAGRDQHLTVHVHGEQSQPQSYGSVRNALASLYVLLQLVGTLAFVVGCLIVAVTLREALFSTLFFQGCGMVGASLVLMMIVERLFTGRWHRWSRPRKRASRT
ncbi:hypothetical protein GCM10010340_46650 [Streptomyces griseoloalbus]|nr:hypothetical protein GCM10010340_46650 [Streptomyces albaduncus]